MADNEENKQTALVVFYSRTGKVRRVAEAIADELGADVEEIVDTRSRRGPFGLLSAARDAVLRRTARIAEPAHDPADYHLVVIGTPVWGWSPSAPVRGYLARVRERLPEVAFFAVARGQGAARAVRVMAALAGRQPRATLPIRRIYGVRRSTLERARRFARQLIPAP
jgi:menaquinone-dependent protoporphyrinogen IX oxidase